jgi:hypothetical protein
VTSAPIDLDNPWLVAIVTGIIVIVAQSVLIAAIWYWRWNGARADIPQRTIEYLKYMSYAVGESLIVKNDVLFIHDQMGAALDNVEDENRGFSDFMSIFSKTIPDGWAVKMSRIADHVSLASNYARRASAAWPTLMSEAIIVTRSGIFLLRTLARFMSGTKPLSVTRMKE